jgi:L-aminopeptidase/D-esterase-like protein
LTNDTLTLVDGLKVGHAEDKNARTGCTVILFEPEADVACEARGGWPGTYDTHSIDVTMTCVKKNAVFLTGGDVFGFDSATGIRRYLLEKGLASATGLGRLPGIVGANIYDVEFATINEARYPDLGYSACKNSSSDPIAEGNVGAGIGATVGKFRGLKYACKGGCGTQSLQLPSKIVVGALVVTNAVGNIFDAKTARTIAGVRRPDGGFFEFEETMADYLRDTAPHNTTIGIVATNVDLLHEQLIKVAQLAHDGLARSIRPVHMSTDGDTMFAASTARISGMRERERIVDIIGYAGARCVASAVVRSVRAARTLSNIPSCSDLSTPTVSSA